MKIYIAGPMTGKYLHNFPAFDAASLHYRKLGFEVVNPAELDRVEGIHEYSPLPEDGYRTVMKRDLSAICDCDIIALLPGWDKSPGTQVELALAKLLKLEIWEAYYDKRRVQGSKARRSSKARTNHVSSR